MSEGRVPPQDVDAEQSVLGGCLTSARAIEDCLAAGLRGQDFYQPAHELVWSAVTGLHGSGTPVDTMTVFDAMRRSGNTERAGGAAYLHTLVSTVPTAANAGYYARIVRERATLRRLVQAGTKVAQLGYAEDGGDVAALVDAAQAELQAVADATFTQDGDWSTLTDIWQDVNADLDQVTSGRGQVGIRWGIDSVDEVMAPIRPGDLAVIVATTGGGKSIAACQIAFDASQWQKHRALVHALEMTRVEIGQRYASALHDVRLSNLIRGDLDPGSELSIRESMLLTPLADHLIVDESAELSLTSLRSSIRRHKPDLVVVDQIPLMTPPDARASREQQMTALSYGLKKIAKDERVAIVACAQLNTDADKRTDKRPQLHDIRESKAIGHAANHVVALHDPTGGEQEHDRAGELDWWVLKARQGRNGECIALARQYHYARITDLGGARR